MEDVGCNWGVRPRWLLWDREKRARIPTQEEFYQEEKFWVNCCCQHSLFVLTSPFSQGSLLLEKGQTWAAPAAQGALSRAGSRPFSGGAPGVALPSAEVAPGRASLAADHRGSRSCWKPGAVPFKAGAVVLRQRCGWCRGSVRGASIPGAQPRAALPVRCRSGAAALPALPPR